MGAEEVQGTVVKSRLLESIEGIDHGFGCIDEPFPLSMKEIWEKTKPQWEQVHGKDCIHVVKTGQVCGAVDGLYTAKIEVPIAVRTADCVPILLSHRSGRKVAAVHAGWRGVRARILRHLWDELKAQGEAPQDWVAAVGPSNGPCCYEVSEDLIRDFSDAFLEFGEVWRSIMVPKPRMLDLKAIQKRELEDIGLFAVDVLSFCTQCDVQEGGMPRFWSIRRQPGPDRQFSAIMRTRV